MSAILFGVAGHGVDLIYHCAKHDVTQALKVLHVISISSSLHEPVFVVSRSGPPSEN